MSVNPSYVKFALRTFSDDPVTLAGRLTEHYLAQTDRSKDAFVLDLIKEVSAQAMVRRVAARHVGSPSFAAEAARRPDPAVCDGRHGIDAVAPHPVNE